jgi:hypothetical protein
MMSVNPNVGLDFNPDDLSQFRPRHYAIADTVGSSEIRRSEFAVQDKVERLVRMCIRRWQRSEGWPGDRPYLPEIIVKFEESKYPDGLKIVASIHEAGTIELKDIH